MTKVVGTVTCPTTLYPAAILTHDEVDTWLSTWGTSPERKPPLRGFAGSTRVVLDLRELSGAYISGDDPAVAADIARRIREAVQILAEYPGAGRVGRVPDTREVVVSGTPHILPYRIKPNAVEVLRVLHAAQKWPDR